jgi:hypothetical protein
MADSATARGDARAHVEIVGTLWWLDRALPGAQPIAEQVSCLLRLVVDHDGTLRPTSVNVCLPNGEPLWVDSQLIVEMPGWPLLRCVVAQQLSRVNRYRLRVLDEVRRDAVLPLAL